jgi:O-antigen/teichoic acid export membrane protein
VVKLQPRAAIARNVFHLVMGQAATLALSLVLSAALGRSLGAADFGLYYLVTTMTTFAYVFAEWGQGLYLVREVARFPEKMGALLGSALAFRVSGAVLTGAVGLLAAWALGYDPRTLGLYAVFIVAYLPLSCAQTFGHVFRGQERMDYDALITVLAKALALGITLPVLALGGRLPSVIVSQGVAAAGALGAAVLLMRRLRPPPVRVTRATIRDLATEGTPLFAMGIAIALQPYLDAVVLSKLAPPMAVGWYGAARTFMNALVIPAAILAGAAYPALARTAADLSTFRDQLRSALRPMIGIGALAAVGTFLFADLLVTVVYSKQNFGPAIAILQVFAPGLFLLFLDVQMGFAIYATGKARSLAVVKLLTVLLSTGLSILLVPWFQARHGNGGLGVVIAFGVSEVPMVIASALLIPRGTIQRSMLLDLARALSVSAATLLLFLALPPLSPLVRISVFLVAFPALSVALGLVNRADLALLGGLLPGRDATS